MQMRNNNRKVSVLNQVMNIPLKFRGGKYHLISNIVLDGENVKADIRYWINDKGRLFPTSKGLRLNYVDLMNIRRLEVNRKLLLLDFFLNDYEFEVKAVCGDIFKGSIVYDLIDKSLVYDFRRCYTHDVTCMLTETSRGIKLTKEDINLIKTSLKESDNSYDLIGVIIDNLHSCFRFCSRVA